MGEWTLINYLLVRIMIFIIRSAGLEVQTSIHNCKLNFLELAIILILNEIKKANHLKQKYLINYLLTIRNNWLISHWIAWPRSACNWGHHALYVKCLSQPWWISFTFDNKLFPFPLFTIFSHIMTWHDPSLTNNRKINTVSYTHLTLPTILLV